MNVVREVTKKVIAVTMSLLLVFSMIPTLAIPAFAAEPDTRVVDPSTMNNWERYFGVGENGIFDTTNAGGIWTDKSVFKDATSLSPVKMDNSSEDFLIALSAIAANKEIKGYSYIPTDTMLVLDVSGSMKSNGTANVDAMVEATNKAIQELLELNNHNRVGVVLYSGNSQFGASGSGTATVVLPLDRYTTSETKGTGADAYDVYLERSGEGDNMQVRVAYTQNKGTTTINVKNSKGQTVSNNNKSVVGGTYIQNGIYKAWGEFNKVEDTTIESGFQAGQKRIPIMVLMSDGAPTSGTTNYTNIGTSNVGSGASKCATNGMGFLTQLTASWARIKMEAKYENTPKVYTLGLGLDNVEQGADVAKSVLDPDNSTKGINAYWNDYNEGTDDVTINAHNSNGNDATYNVSTNSVIKSAVTKAQNSGGKIDMPQYYVDQYYAADNASELIAAFDSIVNQIILQSKYYPTEAELGKHDLGGYIYFEDSIGEFMEVKDMKGILLGNTLYDGANFAKYITTGDVGTVDNPTAMGDEFVFSLMERLNIDIQTARDLIRQAYLAGQISYTNDNNFSNYAGWYADTNGNYLGFAPSKTVPDGAVYIMKSYGYLGYGKITQEESIKDSDLMYMSVRVQEEISTGRQTVQWAIPASLIPTIAYEVALEGNSYETASNIKMVRKDANPVRLVYEVGLIEGINELNIAEFMAKEEHKHTDANGNFEFYTNRWGDNDLDGKIDIDYNDPYSHTVTVVDYTPSIENERYYYTEDTPIYIKNGSSYELVNYDPKTVDGEYYHARRVFKITNAKTGEASVETKYEAITDKSLEKATRGNDGKYYIPAGTVLRDYEANRLNKSTNITGTMEYVAYPFIFNPTPTTDEGYHADTFLGNNGKMTITPATGIKLTKNIDSIEPGTKTDGFQFTIQLSGASLAASYPYQIFDAEGKAAGTGNYNVNDGKIVATLSAGQTVYITGLPAGVTYSIVESEHEDYVVDTINGKPAISTDAATGTIVDRTLSNVEFVNTLKTHGNLVINKVVTHPLGDDYQMPEKQFNVTVQLDGSSVGKNVKDISLQLIGTGETQSTTVKTSNNGTIQFSIKHGETVSIHEIPEGVTYRVIETDLPNGFVLDTENSTDLVGTISKDVNSSEQLVNKYTPSNAYPVNITLTGEKTLEGRVWLEGDAFAFALEKFNGTTWTEVATRTVKKDNPVFNFTSELQAEKYTAVGTYQYRVRELGSDSNGITYDKTIRYFNVTITDVDMDGQLEIQAPKKVGGETVNFVVGTNPTVVTYANDNYNVVTNFNNKYAADTDTYIDLNITKTITNDTNVDIPLNGFYFTLYEADGRTHVMSSDETNALGETYIRVVYNAKTFAKENGNEASIVKDEKGNIVEKTYKYVLKEDIPAEADKIPGMTYNTKSYDVTVVVKDNLDGKLSATVSVDGAAVNTEKPAEADVTHNNNYDLKDTSVGLNVNKHLDGATLKANEFTFELYKADENWSILGNPVQTVKNEANGNVKFADLTFNAVGTYYYVLREHVPTGITTDGITYDTNAYKVTVVVQQEVVNGEETDKLVATKTIENARTGETVTSVTFANKHVATGVGSVTLEGDKVLTGRNLIVGEFGFQLFNAELNGTEYVAKGSAIQTVSNTATGKFIFAPLEYTDSQLGTHYYIIKEVNAGQTINGVTYSNNNVVVKVDVTKPDRDVIATATVLGTTDNKIVLTNTYNVSPTEVQLTATKTLQGRDMAAGEFTFELSDGTTVDTKTNVAAANGVASNIVFNKLTFNAAGTYNYTMKEVVGSLGGVTYDKAVRNVVIKVTDNGKGQLVAAVTIDGVATTNTDFVNTYRTEDAVTVIGGSKTLVGRQMAEGEFWFDLRDSSDKIIQTKGNTANGTFTFDAITYDKVGTHTYTVTERNRHQEGVTYDAAVYTVEVKVTDNGEGKLIATQVITKGGVTVNNIAFENRDPVDAEVVIKGTKTLSGRFIEEGEFSFQLFEGTEEIAKVPVTADGTFEFPKMTYNKEGIYTYTVNEVLPGAGITHVPEKGLTYDDTVHTVVVTVTETNGVLVPSYTVNGISKAEAEIANAVKFENVYAPNSTTAIIDTVTKALTGRELVRGEFEFKLTLVKVDGAAPATTPEPLVAKNGMVYHDGQFVAAGHAYELEFNLNFTKAGTYEYVMEEVIPTGGVKDGVTYDQEKFNVLIEVTDNGSGNLVAGTPVVTKENSSDMSFNNKYEAKSVTVKLAGHKHLEGKALEKGQFEFKLYDETNKEVASVKNGNVAGATLKDFELFLTFDKTGEYKYTLKEVNGGQKIAGITYDDKVYEVIIKVTDDGKGQLVAETTIDGGKNTAIEFRNVYTLTPITEAIASVTKTLTGRDMKADEFSFVIKDEFGVTVQTKQNSVAADGNKAQVVFDAITYDKAGTYKYTIEEVQGTLGGVKYDGTKFDVTVTVVDNGDGTLTATPVVKLGTNTVNGADFINEYTVDPITVDAIVGVNKVLTGRDMEANEFTFQLKDSQDNVVAEGKNEAAKAGEVAKVAFEKITYDAAGQYVYTLAEVEENINGVSYSKDVYEVTVVVTDNGDGTLSVLAPVYKSVQGVQTDSVTFTNEYYYTKVDIEKLQAVNDGNPTKDTLEVKAGDVVTYYLTVTNEGNIAAYNIEIVDKVPAGLEVVDGSIDNNGVLANDGTIKWTMDKIDRANDSGEPGALTVSFKVKVPEVRVDTTWKNVGSVTYTDPSENPDDPNNPDNPKYEDPSNVVEITEKPEIPIPPVTGDKSNMALWTAIMALAATGFIGLGLKKKEEE